MSSLALEKAGGKTRLDRQIGLTLMGNEFKSHGEDTRTKIRYRHRRDHDQKGNLQSPYHCIPHGMNIATCYRLA